MNDSILITIKKLLGIDATYTHFDVDIIIHINTTLSILRQLGVGLSDFRITGPTETWGDFLGTSSQLDLVKSYVYLKVKSLFDPTSSGAINTAFDAAIKELEWRINVAVDPGEVNQNE